MNNIVIYSAPGIRVNGDLAGLKDFVKKVTSPVKNVVQDFAKTAVNTVTRPVLFATGNDPVYKTEDFNTKLFQTGSKIQSATTSTGAKIVNQVVQQKAPGLNIKLPENIDIGPQPVFVPEPLPEEPKNNFSNENIAIVGGGILLLLTAAYFATR
jgi:hypothetical protein